MTHSILKQFFSVDVINHVTVTFSLAIFFSLFLFAITFFQHFKCILFFTIWSCNIKNANGWESQVEGISGYCYHKSQRFVAIFWSSGCISWWLKWIFIFFEVPLKRSEKKFFIHIWHVKSMRHINNKNRDRGGKCGIFFPIYSDPRFMFISLS